MRRGPNMPKGLTLAVPLGFLRGHVMVFMPSVQNLGEFLVAGSGWFVLVSARPTHKLSMSIAEIEAEFRDIIARLRLVPDGGQVSCELWLYSRYGTFRHFRVQKDGLVEINAYGIPLDQVKLPAPGLPFGNTSADVPAGQPAATGTGTAGAVPMSPILRWLKKWNAERLAGKKPVPAENGSLKKILDTGGPATKKRRSSGKTPAGSRPAAGGPADPEKNFRAGKPQAGKTKPAEMKTIGEPGGNPVPDTDPVTKILPNPGSVASPASRPVVTGPVSPVAGEPEKGSPEGGDLG